MSRTNTFSHAVWFSDFRFQYSINFNEYSTYMIYMLQHCTGCASVSCLVVKSHSVACWLSLHSSKLSLALIKNVSDVVCISDLRCK